MRTGVFVIDVATLSVPAEWEIFDCEGRWKIVYPDREADRADVLFVHRIAQPSAGFAAFVVIAPAARLRQVRAVATRAWTVQGLRADNGAAATQIKVLIIDDRVRDDEGVPQGELVALRATIAGFRHHEDAENETELP
jgi:hypothetical protein